jgi:hypothetical protein
MRKFVVILAALMLVATAADARHRRHGWYRLENSRLESGLVSYDRRGAADSHRYDRRRPRIAELIPRDWRREEPDADQSGSHFVSPAGDAWLAFYATPADQNAAKPHWKGVAFADGEELNFLQREYNWVAVSGFRGERMFYRKAVLACGGREWRHIAVEHPAIAKRDFDALITEMARALDRAIDENCDTTVGGREP